jgi:alkanesulfonate monooxygenase SsuD/methylene tetrahydromethanopterin reductase-like flavin-dependent oxidoreductase (luciferase family)
VCKRLWGDPIVEHHGEFFDFGPVRFEPKPVQRPWPPLLVGGESDAALRRAARSADGWIAMEHSIESLKPRVSVLRSMRDDYGRGPITVTVGASVAGDDDLERWADAGVDRLIVAPWSRSREAVDGLRRLAERVGLAPPL